MKKNTIIFLLLFTVLITVSGFLYEAKGQASGLWSGTISERSQVTGQPGVLSESMVSINYNNNVGTGTYTGTGILTVDGKVLGRDNCSGTYTVGFAELSIDNVNKTYTIQTSALIYTCTHLKASSDSGEAYITIADEPWDENPKVLKGSKTQVNDIPGGGRLTTFTTWNLFKGSEVELIVVPVEYDRWLPIPGIDEQTPGPKMMTVTLKLEDRNGRPASEKAKAFKLRLSNTSKERGITINMPLSPAAQSPPDLRFHPQENAVITDEGQLMTISCPAGCLTNSFRIECYDGGAWSTLTAVAVLETDSIKGSLLEPGGEKNILIPKREPDSRIATAWLSQNGNPTDYFDEETSPGNFNKGDGLSAYEEYRGVMHLQQYKRLSAKLKELGIVTPESEIGIFSDGFTRFQNESAVQVILFDKSEIQDNRRLNKNTSYGHVFDQYVLRVQKGNTGQANIYNYDTPAFGLSFGGHDIPARITHIVIDVNRIVTFYREHSVGRPNLPYTSGDMIASTTAHEIGHGVSLDHHGIALPHLPGFTVPRDTIPIIRIFYERGSPEITSRPFTIRGSIGSPNNQQSGNVSCFMCYRGQTRWVRKIFNNEHHYFAVPDLPEGSLFCFDAQGTDINANNRYYGNALNGSCLRNIKLRD